MKAPPRSMAFAVLVLIAIAVASAPLVHAQYTFVVHNNTRMKIVSLLVSESGEEPGEFDIGSGIGPGKSMNLEWDRSTENSHCDWAITAVYSDGTYSQPVMVDFCEPGLELDFDP